MKKNLTQRNWEYHHLENIELDYLCISVINTLSRYNLTAIFLTASTAQSFNIFSLDQCFLRAANYKSSYFLTILAEM